MPRAPLAILAAALAACSPAPSSGSGEPEESTFTATTSDGVSIFGYPLGHKMAQDAPTILLFHQAGSSARGEYEEIASWLGDLGYATIAWDLRKGGDMFGSPNRTVETLPAGAQPDFCDAYPDLEAALQHATRDLGRGRVAVLGSSYSASLVYQLAADNPDKVAAVIAFSPAAGGPLADCKADLWASEVKAPALVLRPASEMERDTSIDQRQILETAGARFLVADPGTHGASMLLDERAGGDASATREQVANWLAENFPAR